MRRTLLFIFVISVIALSAKAQIDAGEDVTICGPQDVNLTADYTPNSVGTSDYILENVPYTNENYAGTIVNLFDDDEEGPFDIGFEFCYFDNTYTQFCIGSNGWITFDCGQPTNYVSGPIPNPTAPLNSIMGPWSDWNPGVGGEVRYETIGTAPNRALVVSWIDVPLFGVACGTYQGKFQIVLRETTNIIENNIEYKTNCPDDGAGGSNIAVQGIHNIDGTVAVVVPGRNATGWEATNESHQYTPIGLAISNVQWIDQLGNLVGTGTDITVTPTSTTTYTAIAQECPNSYSDDVTIIFSPAITTSIIVEDNLCPGQIAGNIDVTSAGGSPPLDFSWTATNGFTSSFEDLSGLDAGSYTLSITDAFDCETVIGPFSISAPPQQIVAFEDINPVTCYGFADGSIDVTMTGGTPNFSYSWNGPNGYTSTSEDINGLEPGIYDLSVLDLNSCPYSNTYEVTQSTLLGISHTTSDYNGYQIRCFGNEDGWVSTSVSGGTTPYTYEWIGPNGFTANFSDIYNAEAGYYTLTVTDANGCPDQLNVSLIQPDSLQIDISNYAHESCTYNNDGFIEIATWGGVETPIGSNNFGPFTQRWDAENFFSTNEDIYDLQAGTYYLTTTDPNDCVNSLQFEIEEPPMVIADYYTLNDTITINFPYASFYDRSEGEVVSWEWNLSNGISSSNQDLTDINFATNLEEIGSKLYSLQLIVTDAFSCSDTTYGHIKLKDEHVLYVPNAFTPDSDGHNDIFFVKYNAIKEGTFIMEIYDRFGTVIHRTTDPNSTWDGTNDFTGNEIMPGVYTYRIAYQDFENWKYDHTNCENCTGTITLIR